MVFFLQWRQLRRKERRLLEETIQLQVRKERLLQELKTHEERIFQETKAHKKRLLQERKAHKKRMTKDWDNQQGRVLLLARHQLECTMDPLLAAQVYNQRFCPLTRLPEELLVRICNFLDDVEDAATLHCLQLVSRTFFRLLYDDRVNPELLKDGWHYKNLGSARFEKEIEFRQLFQREGRCNNCKRWNDTHDDSYPRCKFHQEEARFDNNSLMWLFDEEMLYCNACDARHNVGQFPSTQQRPREGPRRQCLGQLGSVQLCEHVQISWASVKAFLDDWRKQQQLKGGGDRQQWQAGLDSFNIECRHASHDIRCTASELPTWPRARLRKYSSSLCLVLEWKPHSRIDALNLTADGRIPAPELRALFQKFRQLGPADDIFPPSRLGALDVPEMMCFGPLSPLGRFVHYKTEEDDKIQPPPTTFEFRPSFQSLILFRPARPVFPPLPTEKRVLLRCCEIFTPPLYGYRNGRTADIRIHNPSDASGAGISSQCFVLGYEKRIEICPTTDPTDPAIKLVPSHCWLHAMDTRTYPHPQASHVRPQCMDETCVNYYRKLKDCEYR